MLLAGVAIGVVWWLIGVAGFIYWWTSQWDLKTDDLVYGIVIGLFLGPSAWLVGWFMHGSRQPRRVWKAKR